MSKEKTVKQACFLCTSSFQVLGAVALQLSQRMKADILVFDDLKGHKEIAEGLRQANLFENVIPVDFYASIKNRHKRPAIIRRMFFAGPYTSRLIDKNTVYEQIYTSSSAVSKSVVIRGLMKRRDNTGIVLYDDGLGSYSGTGRIRTGSTRFQWVKKLFGWEEPLLHPERFMLFEPALYHGEELSGSGVEAMPKIEPDAKNRELLCRIFQVEEEDLRFPQKVMLFDTFRRTETEECKRMDALFSRITDICGREHVIMKEHPRSSLQGPAPVKRFPYPRVAMELVYAYQEKLEDKILIGLNSTALFTPKMLFGLEPRLILLYKLTSEDPAVTAKRDANFANLVTMYGHPDRVLIPETQKELEDALRCWLEPEGTNE